MCRGSAAAPLRRAVQTINRYTTHARCQQNIYDAITYPRFAPLPMKRIGRAANCDQRAPRTKKKKKKKQTHIIRSTNTVTPHHIYEIGCAMSIKNTHARARIPYAARIYVYVCIWNAKIGQLHWKLLQSDRQKREKRMNARAQMGNCCVNWTTQ